MADQRADMVIDIGNSRMKVALFVEGKLDGVILFSNRAHKQVARLLEDTGAQRGILSNVSKLNKPLTHLFFDHTQMLHFQSGTPVPLKIDYLTPETLGTDRIANAVAAKMLYPNRNVLIIDFGTCIKYDVLTADGSFRGGSIAPGVMMRFKSMHRMTGKLPLISDWNEEECEWPGKNTRGSMISGVIQGIQAEILRYMDVAADHHQDIVVLATGGDYLFFDKVFKNIIFAHPYLTLEGLHEILRYNLD